MSLWECQPGLAGLPASARGIDRLLTKGDRLPAFDCHVSLNILPCRFGTAAETIPCVAPYLHPGTGTGRGLARAIKPHPAEHRASLARKSGPHQRQEAVDRG